MNVELTAAPWTRNQVFVKRSFDIVAASLGLLLTSPILLLGFIAASIDTRSSGLFTQSRIGRNARPFRVYKLRTMRHVEGIHSTVTTAKDPRITSVGRFLRRTKVDELPQLLNVLKGDMSIVGPRPDVSGFADALTGSDRKILSVRPGITGPASLHYRNEQQILAEQANPEEYNRSTIWPNKVKMNLDYIENYSFWRDLRIIFQTVRGTSGLF